MWRSPATSFLIAASFLVSIALLAGCGAGGSEAGKVTQGEIAPAILQQPAGQSVPMGLVATYSVSVTGTPLSYQWAKDGIPVSGAVDYAYNTPATSFSDSGSTFTVTISNALGSVTSTPASLTVTARAPIAGDLRFQQVDAVSTVNGYDNGATGISSGIPGRGGAYFTESIGTPLFMAPIVCSQPPVAPGEGCEWPFTQFFLPSSLFGLGLSTGYGADFFTNYQGDLQSTMFPAAGSPVDSSNSVVTSLDLEAPDGLFAVSWIQSTQTNGFGMSQQTVSPADFQAAATQEGLNHRVITAVSTNAGQVVYLSYGWTGDPNTLYEAQIATASSETAANVASGLAAQGYVITALGGSNLDDSYYLVGTRVRGDVMARPFLTYGTLIQSGYALVGVLQDSNGNEIYLGER